MEQKDMPLTAGTANGIRKEMNHTPTDDYITEIKLLQQAVELGCKVNRYTHRSLSFSFYKHAVSFDEYIPDADGYKLKNIAFGFFSDGDITDAINTFIDYCFEILEEEHDA